jgi:Protein of unknown function (DUF3102)
MKSKQAAAALVERLATRPEFDYSALVPTIADSTRNAAERIKSRIKASVLEIGHDLLAVKEQLEHGQFCDWLSCELGMTPRSAQNYMQTARAFGEKSEIISYLPQALVYQLAAPSTPAPIRDEIVKRFDSGERIHANEIQYALKETRKAERTNANRQSTKERNDAKRVAFLAKLPDDQRAKLLKKENRAELRRLQERAEQDRRDTEYKAERAAEMAAAAEAVALLRRALSNEQIDTLFDLATKAGRYLTEGLANRGEEVVRREIWLPTMLGVP